MVKVVVRRVLTDGWLPELRLYRRGSQRIVGGHPQDLQRFGRGGVARGTLVPRLTEVKPSVPAYCTTPPLGCDKHLGSDFTVGAYRSSSALEPVGLEIYWKQAPCHCQALGSEPNGGAWWFWMTLSQPPPLVTTTPQEWEATICGTFA